MQGSPTLPRIELRYDDLRLSVQVSVTVSAKPVHETCASRFKLPRLRVSYHLRVSCRSLSLTRHSRQSSAMLSVMRSRHFRVKFLITCVPTTPPGLTSSRFSTPSAARSAPAG